MDVIDAEYQCHKQNTSSQEKSCVNRASFVFMANFENFFLRFVMNSYIFFFPYYWFCQLPDLETNPVL